MQNEGEDLKEAVKSLAIKYVDGKYMVEGQVYVPFLCATFYNCML